LFATSLALKDHKVPSASFGRPKRRRSFTSVGPTDLYPVATYAHNAPYARFIRVRQDKIDRRWRNVGIENEIPLGTAKYSVLVPVGRGQDVHTLAIDQQGVSIERAGGFLFAIVLHGHESPPALELVKD
jgi:hypothetical protein